MASQVLGHLKRQTFKPNEPWRTAIYETIMLCSTVSQTLCVLCCAARQMPLFSRESYHFNYTGLLCKINTYYTSTATAALADIRLQTSCLLTFLWASSEIWLCICIVIKQLSTFLRQKAKRYFIGKQWELDLSLGGGMKYLLGWGVGMWELGIGGFGGHIAQMMGAR